MTLMTFYVDGRKRSGWTNVFAMAAADAFLCIYGRHFVLAAFDFYHYDSAGGAVPLTVAAADLVAEHYAVFFDPHGMTDLYGSFILGLVEMNSSCRAYVGTSVAGGRAVAEVELHLRLHEV